MAATEGVRRRPRGERRRREILEAALKVIAAGGIGSVTHRAVAAAADVPAATTTYYFASIDYLLEEALKLFVDEEVERLRSLAARLRAARVSPATAAELFAAELAGEQSQSGHAQFELYLEAARRPRLRQAAGDCLNAYAEVAEAALRAAGAARPAEGARAFVALCDGFALARTAAPDESWPTELLAPALRELFIAFAMEPAEVAAWHRRLAADPEG